MNNLIFPWKYIYIYIFPPSYLKDIFPGYDILGWQFSFLPHFQAILHYPMISIKTLPLSFIVVVLKSNHFPTLLWLFWVFFSSFSLTMCGFLFIYPAWFSVLLFCGLCSVLKNCRSLFHQIYIYLFPSSPSGNS